MKTHAACPIGNSLVICNEHPAFTCGDGLGGIEREAHGAGNVFRDGPHSYAVPVCRERMRRIFNYTQTVCLGHVPNLIHVARYTCNVDWHYCFRLLVTDVEIETDLLGQSFCIKIKC